MMMYELRIDHIFIIRPGFLNLISQTRFLTPKGVEAVGIHGGKDQEDRDMAIRAFKSGRKDVLVATDVASKGLDFPNVQHVINYDMPEDIDNYTHRIGRTGSCLPFSWSEYSFIL